MKAEFAEFWTLRSILENSRWAGALSEEEMQRKYFRERMWEAVRRLPVTEEALSEVLVEIAEEVESERS
jgi:hypothetical protein